jgi:hypothetical protein
MTKEEFNTWKNAYFTAFPDTKAWLAKQENPAGTLATWFKCLSRCDYGDIAIVTDRIVCGELTPIDSFQREQTAIHLRAYAGRLADERKRSEKHEADRRRFDTGKASVRRESGPGVSSMFKQILIFREEAKERGIEGIEVNAYASERLEAWLAENRTRVAVDPAGIEQGDAFE